MNLKKWKKGRGGASRPRPRFWPAGRSRPSPPARHPLPRASVASMRADGRAATPWHAGSVRPTRGAHEPGWTHPGRPPGAPDHARLRPRCQTRSSTRSLALSLARAQQQPRRRSELFFPAAPASSLPFATTSDSSSPFRIQRSRSIALGKPRATGRAHRSESELRRPLYSRGSPSHLHHCLRFRAR